jgi:hypothetical protein
MSSTENNKIIAEFMELRSTNKCIRDENGKYYDYFANSKFSCIKEQEIQIESENGWGLVEQDFLFIEDLKFHSDWNWLMEVVQRIEDLDDCGIDIFNGSVEVYKDGKTIVKINTFKTKIEKVYNACVEFIKWYNEQNK